MFKKCCCCKEVLSSEMFHKNKNNKDGLHYQCKTCTCKLSKSWYERNREKDITRRKAYSESNKEKRLKDIEIITKLIEKISLSRLKLIIKLLKVKQFLTNKNLSEERLSYDRL